MAKAKRPNYRAQIVKAMKALGTYRAEYEGAISVLVQLRWQYDTLTKQFEESGFAYFEQTDSGTKKAPIVTTLESLRKDMLAYMTALGLTPAGAKKLTAAATEKKPEDGKPEGTAGQLFSLLNTG